jgi:hypothetical protein
MRRNEASDRKYSATTGDPKGLYNWDPYEQHGTTKNPQFAEKPKDPIANIGKPAIVTAQKLNPFPTTKEVVYPHWDVLGRRYDDYETARAVAEKLSQTSNEPVPIMQQDDAMSPAFLLEKVGKGNVVAEKKGKPVNPWAICTESVGREDKEKYERCVLDVKKKHPIKKEESSWLPKVEQPKQEKQAEVSESESMWDEPQTSSIDPDSWNLCTVTAGIEDTHQTSSWKLDKKAFPSPVDAPPQVGPAGTECEKCKMTGPTGAKICSNPGCGGKMRSMPTEEFYQKTKTLPKDDVGMPGMASSNGKAKFSHGVFRYVAADGTVAYGDTIKEAQAKTDLSELQPGSLEEEATGVSYFMQEPPKETVVPQAQQVPVARQEVPTQTGVQEDVEPKAEEQHISGDKLDSAYSQLLFQNDAEEQEEYEEQQDQIVLGPDPSTK